MKIFSLFMYVLVAVGAHDLHTPCETIVRQTLPTNTPVYKVNNFINGTCGAWATPNLFCRKMMLGSAFLDIPVDINKLPFDICHGSRGWAIENLYIIRA